MLADNVVLVFPGAVKERVAPRVANVGTKPGLSTSDEALSCSSEIEAPGQVHDEMLALCVELGNESSGQCFLLSRFKFFGQEVGSKG